MAEIKKDIQASSLAEKIANDLNDYFKITWISPFLVQLFIVLSMRGRDIVYAYLQTLRASLITKKAKLVRESLKGNNLANALADLRVATAITMGQIDIILKMVPLDSTLKVIPEVEEFLSTLAADVPIKIPESAIFNTIGIGGFELLEGVTDYRSLRDKIDEIEYRLTRATALSHYAQSGSSYVDGLLKKVDVYLEIIVTLNTQNI